MVFKANRLIIFINYLKLYRLFIWMWFSYCIKPKEFWFTNLLPIFDLWVTDCPHVFYIFKNLQRISNPICQKQTRAHLQWSGHPLLGKIIQFDCKFINNANCLSFSFYVSYLLEINKNIALSSNKLRQK